MIFKGRDGKCSQSALQELGMFLPSLDCVSLTHVADSS